MPDEFKPADRCRFDAPCSRQREEACPRNDRVSLEVLDGRTERLHVNDGDNGVLLKVVFVDKLLSLFETCSLSPDLLARAHIGVKEFHRTAGRTQSRVYSDPCRGEKCSLKSDTYVQIATYSLTKISDMVGLELYVS